MMESKSLVWDYFEIFLFKNMYLLYIKRCNFEYHMGGKISLKNLDLVSNFEIKWQKISISSRSLRFSEQKSRSRLEPWDFVKKSRSRLEARDWRKQNLDLVSKVKKGISPPSGANDPGLPLWQVNIYLLRCSQSEKVGARCWGYVLDHYIH